jgi:hypothetical protein
VATFAEVGRYSPLVADEPGTYDALSRESTLRRDEGRLGNTRCQIDGHAPCYEMRGA